MSAARLSERVRVVRANNPGPMTLDGTNTYLIGDDANVVVIDPGPDDPGHLANVKHAVAGANVVGIFLTHRHHDHAEASQAFADALDAPLGSWSPLEPGEIPLLDGEQAGAHGVYLTAIHTPGHCSDHLCFWLDSERALFTGDHVLGRGTTVVAYPDGDMRNYLDSLDKIRVLHPARLYPGHGPVIEDPQPVLDYYVSHRIDRENQVIAAMPGTPEELVERIYTDVDPALHPVAAMSVRAHLAKLLAEGRATTDGDDRWSAMP